MNDTQYAAQIEALLFALGRPLSSTDVQKLTGLSEQAIEAGINHLRTASEGRGVVLVDDGNVLELRTAPATAELIDRVRKEEYARDIGRAGLEVLAAVLYRGPLSRSEIDFIRGVNSAQTVRNLSMRGLIRKVHNPKDPRSFLWEATTELLSELGIMHRGDIPEYETVKTKLADLEGRYRKAEAPQDQL